MTGREVMFTIIDKMDDEIIFATEDLEEFLTELGRGGYIKKVAVA